MYFKFQPVIPEDYDNHRVKLLSGEDSVKYSNKEYLICKDSQGIRDVFQINFEYSCSPFKEALIIDNLIAVGHEKHFYLYNLENSSSLSNLKVDGYFGHLYYHEQKFYVADASGIHCIDAEGIVVWSNDSVGIDGVVIHEFENDKIFGVGEWDPPGRWRHFVLYQNNGKFFS